MFQNVTYEKLLNRMLKTASASNSRLDTREGSLLWLGSAPAAVELQNLYLALDTVLDETFADTASREHLILRAAERGLSPLPASPAVLELTVTPAALSLPMNTRFSIGTLNYFVSRDMGGGKYEITCETAGDAGNNCGDMALPIEYIAGLETCAVTALLVPGEDAEETEAFRRRYLDSLNAQAFGGNRQDYLEKINTIPGVGGVKVYRAWNGDIRPADLIPPEEAALWLTGVAAPAAVKEWLTAVYTAAKDRKLTVGGTVEVVVTDSIYAAPSDALVDLVQRTVDPPQNAGEGMGIAPIGHVVHVEGVQNETVNLSFTLTYQAGWDWEAVKPYVTDVVNQYFQELAKAWASQKDTLVVRVSQLESRILGVSGVLDISDMTVNGTTGNYALALDHIPVLGAIEAKR